MCSKVSWNAIKAVYQPLLIEDSSQFHLAEVGRVHVRRMLDALDALDAGLGDIFSSELAEARVSKSVKEVLRCTLLSCQEADLTLKAEAHLGSMNVAVRGRADYLVARGDSTLMVVEVKKEENLLRQGKAQALLMLDITFTNNPAYARHVFGIASDFSTWLFFKRTPDGIYHTSDTIAKKTRDQDAERVVRRLCKMLQS
ncbi:hypothetical protein PHYSODRAFT_340737 [Phytophthora sojae]|uniref:Uncharacterized protein n=1 Tax=Phytophthora sojae (strain P6497) TaxID=1094619 RepID=G5AAQ3_PHYSP|nr:hypothetical protein PHYSODRAFT_340737 [Phytophthora sojae]EGZ07682.1 hypothetical protein PHYSODRAFT_340737 [Phytophthora sojae]|eukprot:XP_009537248.1 hypothetical protein PHYSODRAFT_340737 [Phytophthora sojae]